MTPPPPPPPPTPGTPMAPSNGHLSPPPPPPPAAAALAPVSPAKVPVNDHNDQLMAAIRAGVTLNPTKTKDCSTPGFIKGSNGVLDANGKCDHHTGSSPDEQGIEVIKDALQAELRNTLKRKIKKQEIDDGDCAKNEEIERSIEATRSEIQLKVNGVAEPASQKHGDTPKVENPLKKLVDVVDKERGVNVATAVTTTAQPKQPSPVLGQKAPSPNTTSNKSVDTPKSGTKAVTVVMPPVVNGNTVVLNVSPTPWKPSVPATTSPIAPSTPKSAESNGPIVSPTPWKKTVSPTTVTKAPSSPKSVANEPAKNTTVTSPQTPRSENVTSPGVAPAVASLSAMFNGGSATNTLPKMNGTLRKATSGPYSPPTPGTPAVTNNGSTQKATNNSFSNTLPRVKSQPTAKSTPPSPMYTATVKVPITSFTDSPRNVTPIAAMEPLTIDTTSNGSSAGTASLPTTPKELLSPQVRSGAASIRPSQIRSLTKSGSPVSHTDIRETPKAIPKLPVTLVEPTPVLTAAAAASPPPATPPASPRNGDGGSKASPGSNQEQTPKERTFERATKDTKSPLNRWNEGGGTVRKLLISHGRPNFTIKRSNSRQGFDVDVADSNDVDAPKPVFRILTDLENSEREQDQQQQQQQQQQQPPQQKQQQHQQQHTPVVQQYVSFAKDLSNAPNNHPDVAVVKKTLPPKEPTTETDPFLATLKDIKIDIDEMKVVVQAKDS